MTTPALVKHLFNLKDSIDAERALYWRGLVCLAGGDERKANEALPDAMVSEQWLTDRIIWGMVDDAWRAHRD